MQQHTLTVVLSFPIARVKAEEVLEHYWKRRGEKKLYMREYRKPKPRAVNAVRQVVTGS